MHTIGNNLLGKTFIIIEIPKQRRKKLNQEKESNQTMLSEFFAEKQVNESFDKTEHVEARSRFDGTIDVCCK